MEPATKILRQLGGPAEVARALGLPRQVPYTWTWPRERGGTGGTIPQRHHVAILREARERGAEITAEDFLPAERHEATE